uniref:Uncharacterized protein n=1 Tax=Macaca nemestrina TaxID=9545 RepID=A0A2K6AWP3_MACNE
AGRRPGHRGAAGDADGPGGPGVPEAGAAGDGVPRVQGSKGSGPGGGAPRVPRGSAASAQNGSCQCGPGGRKDLLNRVPTGNITMPFSSPIGSGAGPQGPVPDATPLPRPGDFTVSGNPTFIPTANSSSSISSCLQQLSWLMWIVQCFLPMFLALLHSGQRR